MEEVDDVASHINDTRDAGDFKGISFSGYKLNDVKEEYIQSLLKNKIEPACNWCAELVCSGHLAELWEAIFLYVGKHIHVGNPKMIIYVKGRYDIFRNIMIQGYYSADIHARNTTKIRKLFAEITCILALSDKKQSFETVKINREEEFDILHMQERLKATSAQFAEPIFNPEDPKELYVAVNEFAYNIIGDTPNLIAAFYWIEWIIEFDSLCKKRAQKCVCFRRADVNVESKYQKDIIWIAWDVLIHYGATKGELVIKTLESIMSLFCVKYTTASCKRRKYLLYFATSMFTEHIGICAELMRARDRPIIQSVTLQINQIYRALKKIEHTPNTDYMFASFTDKQATFDKSVNKLKLMDSMMGGHP